jgi:GrpB-like predicted nucleotidyltransferase (UPF0157 family)
VAGRVTLSPYDPRWPGVFEAEKERLAKALAPYALAIEHIGSTAVPGLEAKATIDILAGIYQLSDAPRCIERMKALGYEYVPEFEAAIPERRYFRKALGGRPEAEHLFHVHMVEVGSAFFERDLLFRDYLRGHPDTASAYTALKRELAAKHGAQREAYTDGKAAFVRSVQDAARAERASGKATTGLAAGAKGPPHPQ